MSHLDGASSHSAEGVGHPPKERQGVTKDVIESILSKVRKEFPNVPELKSVEAFQNSIWQTLAHRHPPTNAQSVAYHIKGPAFFEGSEHRFMTDLTLIYNPESKTDVLAHDVKFSLSNGYQLTLGTICCLAGDFYSTKDLSPISSRPDGDAIQAAFLEAFGTLNGSENDNLKQITDIIAVLDFEFKKVYGDNPADPVAEFEKIATEDNVKFNKITGGKGDANTYFLEMNWGRYMKIAAKNLDHFGNNALRCYKAGHTVALNTAAKAHSMPDGPGKYSLFYQAYQYEGFAFHYLTDIFSAGHMRTPREVLHGYGSFGDLATYFMHNEDNDYGLYVTNKNGTLWKAYGDKHYWTEDNRTNRVQIALALQASVDELKEAYLNGTNITNFGALNYVADLTQLADPFSQYGHEFPRKNHSPLFKNDSSYPTYVDSRDEDWNVETYQWSWRYSAGLTATVVKMKAQEASGTKPSPPPSTFPPIFGSGLLALKGIYLDGGDVVSASDNNPPVWFLNNKDKLHINSISFTGTSIKGKNLTQTTPKSYLYGESVDSSNVAIILHDFDFGGGQVLAQTTIFRDLMSGYVWFLQQKKLQPAINVITFDGTTIVLKAIVGTTPKSSKGVSSIVYTI